MAWQPEEAPIRELAGYLKDSLDRYNQAAQRHASEVCSPFFNFYLFPIDMHVICIPGSRCSPANN